MTDEQKPEFDEPEMDPEQESAEPSDAEMEHEEPHPRPPAQLERLQKILAQAGIASRRAAEELIREGRVQVNGQIITELGTKADAANDHIRVDGKLLHGAERLRYFVLNKPRGYVTTVKDPEGRPTVMEFFAKTGERLYPVGRLDYLSEGLLLITNDGPLANALTRAASGVEKTYLVKVAGQPSEELLDQLRAGVSIDRGRRDEGKRRGVEDKVQTAPARIHQVRPGDNPWFEVVLIEGRNRELRKMFEEIGHHVEKIRRVGYGPLVLDQEPGKMRELDPREVEALRLTAAGKLKPKRIKATRLLPKEAGLSTEERTAKTARLKRGGRQTGRDFKPRFESKFKPKSGFKPKSESGFKPPFKRTFKPGFESRPESGTHSGSNPSFQSSFQSRPGPSFGAASGSSFGSGARPHREEATDRPRKPFRPGFSKSGPTRSGSPRSGPAKSGFSRSGPARSGPTSSGPAQSGSDRPFRDAKPAWTSRGGPSARPAGRSIDRPARPFTGKPTGRPAGRPAQPFKSNSSPRPAGRPIDRPARPFTGKPADRPARPFKAKPFGKPGFGERSGARSREGASERTGEKSRERSGQPSRPSSGSGVGSGTSSSSGPRKSAFGKPGSGPRSSSGPRKSAFGKPGSGPRKSSFSKPGSWKGGSGKPSSGPRKNAGSRPGGGRGGGKGPFRPGGKRGGNNRGGK